MTRRFAFLGLLVVVAQLASGCCFHRCGWWRAHHPLRPCLGVYSSPVSGVGPAIGGNAGCTSCASPQFGGPVVSGPVVYGPPTVGPVGSAGYPIITSPMPIYSGANVDPGTSGIPSIMPPGKPNN